MSDDDLPYWSAHEFAGLPYRYFAPPGPPGRGALLLFLHGIGERGKDNKAQLSYGFFRDPESLFSPAHLIANHCHVLAPQCPLFGKWANINLWFLPVHMAAAPTPSLATVWQLLAAYRRNPAIDPTRVYLSGLSMGGYGAYDLLARHPGQFAAATIVCGGGDVERAAAIGTVPLRLYHGARDPLVTVRHSRTMVAALTAAGAAPEYQGVRQWWP